MGLSWACRGEGQKSLWTLFKHRLGSSTAMCFFAFTTLADLLSQKHTHTHTLSQGNAAWPVWEVCFLYPSCLTTSPLVFKLASSFQTRRHCSAAIVPLRLAADSFVVKFTLPEVAKPFTLQDLLSATANDDCAACRVRHFLKGKMYILVL